MMTEDSDDGNGMMVMMLRVMVVMMDVPMVMVVGGWADNRMAVMV